MKSYAFVLFSPTEKLGCFKISVVFGSYFPVNMFLFKSLPQELFCSEDANSNKLILHCYHAAGLGLRDTVKFPPGHQKTKESKNNSDRKQASNSERTDVKLRFSELVSDCSQICLRK